MKTLLAAVSGAISLLTLSFSTLAVDGGAGQKTLQTTCSGCRQFKSYGSKSSAELETDIKGIVAGAVMHPKKLILSEAEITVWQRVSPATSQINQKKLESSPQT
jgi:hypothetical protein